MFYFLLLMIACFALLQVGDVYTTYVVLSQHGRETNKLVAWVIGKLGVLWGLVLVKVASSIIIGICCYLLWDTFWLYVVLGWADMFYAWVVVHNYRQFRS